LVLATGNVDLPDLREMTLEEAQEILSELNLTARTQEQETGDFDPGTVIDQDRQGPGIPRFSTITLTVAVEPVIPEPTQEPTTEEPTAPADPTDEPTDEEPTDEEPPSSGRGNSDFGRDQGNAP